MFNIHEIVNIQFGDITRCHCDAIVNSAHETLRRGSGVCGAIHLAAGKDLEKECIEKYGKCEVGKAVATSAYNLPCKYVIHTVTPRYIDINTRTAVDRKTKERQLYDCYQNSLALAVQYKVQSMAFPCLALGRHGFPVAIGAAVAVQSIADFLQRCAVIKNIMIYCANEALLIAHQRALNDPPV